MGGKAVGRITLILPEAQLEALKEAVNGADYVLRTAGKGEVRGEHPDGSVVRIFDPPENHVDANGERQNRVIYVYAYPPGGTKNPRGPVHPFPPYYGSSASTAPAERSAHRSAAAAGDDDADAAGDTADAPADGPGDSSPTDPA